MNPSETERLEVLQTGEYVPLGQYVTDYYGLSWPLATDTATDLEKYRKTRRQPAGCPEDCVSRYELEGYMVRADVVPRKWMAARLGMTLVSLERLLDKLADFGMHTSRYEITSEFVATALSEDLARFIQNLRFRTFRDHNDFCRRLHVAIKDEIALEVEPMFCSTSEQLGEDPPRYSMHFDCLTLKPLSTKHSAWLDFHKPIRLPPDRCSKLFYAANREALRPYAAGTTEPDDLG